MLTSYNPVISDETIELLKKGDAYAEVQVKNAIADKDKTIYSLENENAKLRNAHRGVALINSLDFDEFADVLISNGYRITAELADDGEHRIYKISYEEREAE